MLEEGQDNLTGQAGAAANPPEGTGTGATNIPAEPQRLSGDLLEALVDVPTAEGIKPKPLRSVVDDVRRLNQQRALDALRIRDAEERIREYEAKWAQLQGQQPPPPPQAQPPMQQQADPFGNIPEDDILARKVIAQEQMLAKVLQHLERKDQIEREQHEQRVMHDLGVRTTQTLERLLAAEPDVKDNPIFRDALIGRAMNEIQALPGRVGSRAASQVMNQPEPFLAQIFNDVLFRHREYERARGQSANQALEAGLQANQKVGLQGAGGQAPLPSQQKAIETDPDKREVQVSQLVDEYMARREAQRRLAARG